ncbi:MAG: SDR family oxidoreductase [Armatimonadota bacterium]
MAESLEGMTALVTGGAKRIGRATCLALAREGVNIVIHYNTSGGDAESLADEVRGLGVESWTIQADFEKPEEYELLIGRTLDTAGSLNILVNNASIFPKETLGEMTFQSFNANMQVNAWVPFVLSREFKLKVGKGKIINMLDSRVKGYDWNHTGYILSKHAFSALTMMIALEYAPDISVNSVAPGLILPPPGKDESYIDQMKGTVPMKKHGGPEDIADAIVYLAKSDFLTGEVIFVDGGRHLKEYISERKNTD